MNRPTETMIAHARALAIPTIRSILRKRENAIRYRKVDALSSTACDIARAVRAALALGVDADDLLKIGVDRAVIMREQQGIELVENARNALLEEKRDKLRKVTK